MIAILIFQNWVMFKNLLYCVHLSGGKAGLCLWILRGTCKKTEKNVKNPKHWKVLEKSDGYDGDHNSQLMIFLYHCSLTGRSSGMTEWWVIREVREGWCFKKPWISFGLFGLWSEWWQWSIWLYWWWWWGKAGASRNPEVIIPVVSSLNHVQPFIFGIIKSWKMLHLNFVSCFVSDNNVVGDTLWMETLWHPEKQILTLTKKKVLILWRRCEGNWFWRRGCQRYWLTKSAIYRELVSRSTIQHLHPQCTSMQYNAMDVSALLHCSKNASAKSKVQTLAPYS